MLACEAGWEDCDDQVDTGCETDVGSDETHCGDCTTACDSRSTCFQGACCPAIQQDEMDGFSGRFCQRFEVRVGDHGQVRALNKLAGQR